MRISDIHLASADELAPVLIEALQRLGQLGRAGAVALAALVEDGDADFDEAAGWIEQVASGGLTD